LRSGDLIESIDEVDALRAVSRQKTSTTTILPASHYATPSDELKRAIGDIRAEPGGRLDELQAAGKLLASAPRAALRGRLRVARADGLLLRHRELLAAPRRPRAARAAHHAHRQVAAGPPSCSSTSRAGRRHARRRGIRTAETTATT
jgi:hypothetical protein